MTTSASPALTNAEQIFKDLVWNPMIAAGENWLEIQLPFLALPVIKQLDEKVIEQITDDIFNALVLLLDVTAIKWKIAANENAYTIASLQLLIIAQESGITSDAFYKARALAQKALSQFTQLPGA